jgi:hypothetical protein
MKLSIDAIKLVRKKIELKKVLKLIHELGSLDDFIYHSFKRCSLHKNSYKIIISPFIKTN